MMFLKVSHEVDPPHIWWCATGPLAFLPIHAAGIYGKSTPGHIISDYVVSSYTPTLNAIINATQSCETLHKFRGLLAVCQPNTPGQSALPHTKVEVTQIKQHALGKFIVYPLEGSVALVKSVIEGMESHSWVHLACHAVQNCVEPTKSAFCLHDGHLELSTIITKQFPHADFAFLSACKTATGDEKLSEEAVHLAAGLLLAGYRSVIATMWAIKDEDAPVIVDHVYSELFSDIEPDSTKAALALHHAIKHLREVKGDKEDLAFLSWIPFIHVGV
jgi:CHAT domain-containing protein